MVYLEKAIHLLLESMQDKFDKHYNSQLLIIISWSAQV